MYAADLSNMGGGVIEEIGVRLATKLGEKRDKIRNIKKYIYIIQFL